MLCLLPEYAPKKRALRKRGKEKKRKKKEEKKWEEEEKIHEECLKVIMDNYPKGERRHEDKNVDRKRRPTPRTLCQTV